MMRKTKPTYSTLTDNNVKGIFAYIIELNGFPIPNVDGNLVDYSFTLLNGQRRLPQSIINMLEHYTVEETNKRLAETMILMYGEKWKRQEELLQYEITGNKRTVTEKVKDNGTNTQDTTDTKKVSAYDSETFVNDSQDTFNASGTNTNDKDRTLEETLENYQGIDPAIERMQNRLIYDIMFTDVQRFVVLELY